MAIKKKVMLVMLVTCLSAGARAQGVDQLIEQLVLDIQKLSQLKTILQDMKDGYQVLDKGYSNIRDIVSGNFGLHKAFLDGLLAVSPNVRRYYKVPAIIDQEQSIVVESQAVGKRWMASGVFTPEELAYLQRTYAALIGRAASSLDRLTMVTTANELRMSDADRMEAIDRIHADVTGQLSCLRRFNDAVTIQAMQRARESHNVQLLKSFYGNHP